MDHRTEQRNQTDRLRLLTGFAVLYLPLVFLGYGTDGDTYAVLEMGRHLRDTGLYHPSRFPGYPVFELAMAGLAPVGGSILTNLCSLAMGLWCLASVFALAEGLPRATRLCVVAGLALQPTFVIAATSSHDMIWALAFALGSAAAAAGGHPWRAGILAGLAAATRLQMAPLAAGFLILGWWRAGDRRRWLGAGALGAGLAAAFYLPSAAAAGWSWDFLQVSMGDDRYWAGLLRLAKFAYKNLALWGLPAVAVLAVAAWRGRRGGGDLRTAGLAAALILFLVTEALFLRYPIEKAYLLPAVPGLLLLVGSRRGVGRRVWAALLIALAAHGVIHLNPARPDVPDEATGARYGLWFERGDLVEDVGKRWALRGVDTSEGYVDTMATLDR